MVGEDHVTCRVTTMIMLSIPLVFKLGVGGEGKEAGKKEGDVVGDDGEKEILEVTEVKEPLDIDPVYAKYMLDKRKESMELRLKSKSSYLGSSL